MSKYVCIADLHCREVWKKIVEKEKDANKIIFLGDYTVPRDVKYDDPTDACGFLYDVLDFKDKHSDQVVLLRGNHDDCSLGYYWARCYPQDHPKVSQYWQTEDVKNWFLKNTQWAYQIPCTNIICSHAGISTKFQENVEKEWIRQSKILESIKSIRFIDKLNSLEPSELFGFTDDNPFDTNGTSKCQPCTWIRPETLIDYCPERIIQVVGHTPVTEHIFNIDNKIWCCDALGLKEPEYLVIENVEFKVCKV